MLGPLPFLQQLLGERIAVGPALRIEARAGIAVPVPGAADIGAGLEDFCAEPEPAQPVELVQAGDAGADDDDVRFHLVMIGDRRHRRRQRPDAAFAARTSATPDLLGRAWPIVGATRTAASRTAPPACDRRDDAHRAPHRRRRRPQPIAIVAAARKPAISVALRALSAASRAFCSAAFSSVKASSTRFSASACGRPVRWLTRLASEVRSRASSCGLLMLAAKARAIGAARSAREPAAGPPAGAAAPPGAGASRRSTA